MGPRQGAPLKDVTAELVRRLLKLMDLIIEQGLFGVPKSQWEALLAAGVVLPLRGFNKRACMPPPPPPSPPSLPDLCLPAGPLAAPPCAARRALAGARPAWLSTCSAEP